MTNIPDEIQTEINDLIDTVKVLHRGVLEADRRFQAASDELKRLNPDIDDWSEFGDPSGLSEVDMWLDAMVAELVGGHNGVLLKRQGRTFAEQYERFGVPVPASASYRNPIV